MSAGAVVAMAVGGSVLFMGLITWLIVRFNRRQGAAAAVTLAKLREELPRRGWTYVERDDSLAEAYNRQYEQFWSPEQSQFWRPNQPVWRSGFQAKAPGPLEQHFIRPPHARSAHDIITGTHRGRPFVAATLEIFYMHQITTELCIWVRTPAPCPPVYVRQTVGMVSKINAAVGQGDFRTGHPAFDDRFDVNGPDERFLAHVITPALAEFLLTDERRFRGFTLFADRVDALDRIRDHRDPAELVAALDLRCDILDRIPLIG
ncbi:hypothetical protein [Amycolatopsis thermoflava]|uniref:hypothetical protein n=1 Tax=Amycolatopsis thermoflava TaxID=84480 RepID=UPI003D704FE5